MGKISSFTAQFPELCIPSLGDSAFVGYWFIVYITFWGRECYSGMLVEPLMGHANILLGWSIPCDLYGKAGKLCDNAITGTP